VALGLMAILLFQDNKNQYRCFTDISCPFNRDGSSNAYTEKCPQRVIYS
jgi:hypothetical protein